MYFLVEKALYQERCYLQGKQRVTSFSFYWTTSPFWKGVYYKRKEFAPKVMIRKEDKCESIASKKRNTQQVNFLHENTF